MTAFKTNPLHLVCVGVAYYKSRGNPTRSHAHQMPAPMFLVVKILHRHRRPNKLVMVHRGHDKARRWQQRPKLPTRRSTNGRGRALWMVPRRYPRSFGPWKLWRGVQIPCTSCRQPTSQVAPRCRACIQIAVLHQCYVKPVEFHAYPEAVYAAHDAILCLERVARSPAGIHHSTLAYLTQGRCMTLPPEHIAADVIQ